MCFFTLSLFDHLRPPGGPEVYEQQTLARPHPGWDDCLHGTASSHPQRHPGFPPAPTCFWEPAALSTSKPELRASWPQTVFLLPA